MPNVATVRALLLAAICLAATPAHSQDNAASLGKQRAALSPLRWEIREASHPILGPIRFAFLTTPVTTAVGNASVSSNVYVSCEKNRRRIAIELANATKPDDPGGLKPVSMPRLACQRPDAGRIVQEALDARWQTNELGDVLARGLAPFPLRECIAIGVQQEVALPDGWTQKSTRIAFEIPPYARELDAIFATCGEKTAYAPLAPAAPAASKSRAASAPRAASNGAAWKAARTTSNGITWVRAKPSARAPITAKIYPGDLVLVQEAGEHWWHIKPRKGAAFDGYVRHDRVVFE